MPRNHPVDSRIPDREGADPAEAAEAEAAVERDPGPEAAMDPAEVGERKTRRVQDQAAAGANTL